MANMRTFGEQRGVWEQAGPDLPSLSRGHLEEPLAWRRLVLVIAGRFLN